MENKSKTALQLTAGGLIVALAGAAGGAMLAQPEPIVVEKIVEKEIYKQIPVEVVVEKEVEKIIEVEKEVLVDNGNLHLVLDAIYDNNGNVSYLVDGLDDDELGLIVDRIVFEFDTKAIAEQVVREKAFDELHREDVNGTRLHREDMRGLRVDVDETSVDVIDYEDKDAEVFVTVTFRQGSERFEAVLGVLIKDGEVDDLYVESVNKL
jgi:hypothetical protein